MIGAVLSQSLIYKRYHHGWRHQGKQAKFLFSQNQLVFLDLLNLDLCISNFFSIRSWTISTMFFFLFIHIMCLFHIMIILGVQNKRMLLFSNFSVTQDVAWLKDWGNVEIQSSIFLATYLNVVEVDVLRLVSSFRTILLFK